jgi:hypothetical protein
MSVSLVKGETYATMARRIGAADGIGAASWAFDGRTADHIFRAFLVGYADGDPQIMDYYDPGYPLSGEWADGRTSTDVLAMVGIGTDDTPWESAAASGAIDDTLNAYEESFAEAYWAELERVAIFHTA